MNIQYSLDIRRRIAGLFAVILCLYSDGTGKRSVHPFPGSRWVFMRWSGGTLNLFGAKNV